MQQGTGHIISFVALFGIINNLGGLAGSALLGTYQTLAEKAHSAAIVQNMLPTDPQVSARITAGSSRLANVIADPAVLRSAEGSALLSQSATREANVLGYNDTFRFVALLAAATTLYLAFLLARRAWRERRERLKEASA